MSDYSGIGGAVVFLAVLAAFAVPLAIMSVIGLVLASVGFTTAATVFGALGFVSGVVCAAIVGISA